MIQGAQLYIPIIDNDEDISSPNEFVDSFAININSDSQVGGLIIRHKTQSTYGWATMSLTVRVLCAEHYSGERCENYDACSALQITCTGQGTCTNSMGTYNCECEPGYTGRDCETDVDECLLMETECSGRGTCTNGVNDFTCNCNKGFTGMMCETNIDECVGVNCSGRGQCTDGVNSFNCDCNEGFTGMICETNIDDCVRVNCSGHGQCMDGVNNFTCLCQSGFTGQLCSIIVQGIYEAFNNFCVADSVVILNFNQPCLS